jgi:pectin methylesterase-like acyl-CoA thioesterase
MLVLVPLLIGAVSATTWYVDDDGGAGINFTKIQEAVDAAQNNDTIIVYNGTYEENVVLKKSLTLQGEDRENTIIDNSSGNGSL